MQQSDINLFVFAINVTPYHVWNNSAFILRVVVISRSSPTSVCVPIYILLLLLRPSGEPRYLQYNIKSTHKTGQNAIFTCHFWLAGSCYINGYLFFLFLWGSFYCCCCCWWWLITLHQNWSRHGDQMSHTSSYVLWKLVSEGRRERGTGGLCSWQCNH